MRLKIGDEPDTDCPRNVICMDCLGAPSSGRGAEQPLWGGGDLLVHGVAARPGPDRGISGLEALVFGVRLLVAPMVVGSIWPWA